MLVIIALFVPRALSLYLYFFTNWFDGVFQTMLWPVLGFLFMPYTMLWYSAVVNWYGGQWEVLQIVVLLLAVMADFAWGA